jgi:hypothetical protein
MAYALPFASDPFMGKAPARWLAEPGRGWRHTRPSPLSILSGPGHFRRSSHWRDLVVFAGSGSPRWSRQLAAVAAGPLDGAGLPDLAPWSFLDVSRQTTLPLAYPGSHPHDTSPRNWRSLMG